jgi:hypothetical protein
MSAGTPRTASRPGNEPERFSVMQRPLPPQVLNFCFQTRQAVGEVAKAVPAMESKLSTTSCRTAHWPHLLRDKNGIDIFQYSSVSKGSKTYMDSSFLNLNI